MATEKKDASVKTKRPSALKRDIQAEKRNVRNRAFKAKVTTAIRGLREAAASKKDEATVKKQLASVYSLMDKGVKTGILKMNQANRTKSRVTQALKKA